MAWEISEMKQGGPGQQTLQVGGDANDHFGEPGEQGVVGIAINVPAVPMPVPDHAPPCQIDAWHALVVGLARFADIWYTGGTIYDTIKHIGGSAGDILCRVAGENASQCVLLSVRIPKDSVLTRIQTTSSTNGIPAGGGMFRMDPPPISQLIAHPLGSYPGYGDNGSANTHCLFEAPALFSDNGSAVPAGDSSAVVVAAVFKNWSHELNRTPFLRAYYRVAVHAGPRIYVVRPGDSLSRIAQRELGDQDRWREIYNSNRDQIVHPDLVKVGQRLRLP